ncbi:NUDIX hydrolase [Sphingomonas bacterium]|uniref:NUDIX hydrolase n=1 Tax=Sphingomonas bacterium TaxID=1895847 RepID=UPI00157755D3|nr:NUDIX domain-containing protein [Sphingomonas bacterium]
MTGPVVLRTPRPAARILLVDGAGRVLLFRFTVPGRAPFWVTPGGALDAGESYGEAARRELREETGIAIDPGPEVARRIADFETVEGVPVTADERYFRVDIETAQVDPAGHTELERRVMTHWRWFAPDELAGHDAAAEGCIYPADLADLLAQTDRR